MFGLDHLIVNICPARCVPYSFALRASGGWVEAWWWGGDPPEVKASRGTEIGPVGLPALIPDTTSRPGPGPHRHWVDDGGVNSGHVLVTARGCKPTL